MTILCRRGQSTGEYAVLFAIVLGAVMAMQNFVRDRIEGKIKEQANAAFNGVNVANLPTRMSDSQSRSAAKMSSSTNGTLGSDSDSRQIVQ